MSTVKPLSHLRLLGVLVAPIMITTLNSLISYGGKSHEKYLVHAFVYIKVLCVYKRCHRKYCNYNLFFWRQTFTTVMSSPLGGKQQLFQTAQDQQHTARPDMQPPQREHGQDPTCSASRLPLALSLQANRSWRRQAILAGFWPGQ